MDRIDVRRSIAEHESQTNRSRSVNPRGSNPVGFNPNDDWEDSVAYGLGVGGETGNIMAPACIES